jgi:retinol dehydrogenase 12
VGLAVARSLAERGWGVVGVSRRTGSGAAAAAEIRRETGNADVHHLAADLSRPGEVRAMVQAFSRRFERLDVLVANAGALTYRRTETEDGLERTFALNHLGAFLPTVLLLPQLIASPAGRVVVVTSNAAHYGRLQLDDPQSTRRYDAFRAYAWTKLANVLFTRELARRLEGTRATANAVHPGFLATRLGHDGSVMGRLVQLSQRVAGRSPERGADTPVWLATSPEVAGQTGGFYVDRRRRDPPRLARDEEAQRRLWLLSERLTGWDATA